MCARAAWPRPAKSGKSAAEEHMGKVAFVFPGQGSQSVGMGKAAFESEPLARETFEAADEALDIPLSRLCFEGPDSELRLTTNTQPALLTVSIALYRALGERPDVVAGHSLGEYSANVAAGTLPFAEAVKLVRVRGAYMQEAVPVGKGAMAAVLGGELAAIERVCAEASGVVQPVNYNSPGQLVIAGEAEALQAVTPVLKELGCKVVSIPVSAPFHSSLMKPAEERLAVHLREASFAEPSAAIYVNVDAVAVTAGAAAREALIRQVSRPVRWQESVERMRQEGVTLFVEVGPGKVLAGLLKRIDKGAACINVQAPSDFEAARKAIAEARAS
jgi:[acyl-carrier-protein] S-malonyltransferase